VVPTQIQNLPDEYLFPVASLIRVTRRFPTIIDLFAGDGTTLDYLAWHWNMMPHAIEIDANLAQQCKKRLSLDGDIACADMLSIYRPGAFDIVYAFPPSGTEYKIDISYLNHALTFVRPGGVLIYATYQTRFTFVQASAIYDHASEVSAWIIPAIIPGDNLNMIVAQIDPSEALGYDPNEITMFTQQIQIGNVNHFDNILSTPLYTIGPSASIKFQN
jgi:hypothetical protein